MFSKIKEIFKILDELKVLKKDLSEMHKDYSESMNKQNALFEENFDRLNDLSSNISKTKKELLDLKSELSKTIKHFNDELNSFYLTKKNIQDKLFTEFEQESKSISAKFKEVIESFNFFKNDIKDISLKIKSFEDLLNNLTSLSKRISEKDYDLKNYALQLEKNDREKVELLKKIDSLERLLASMKRSRRK